MKTQTRYRQALPSGPDGSKRTFFFGFFFSSRSRACRRRSYSRRASGSDWTSYAARAASKADGARLSLFLSGWQSLAVAR